MKKQASSISRRQALKTLIAGGAAVAASHAGQANAESQEVTKAVKGEGYRETDHIRAYYASLQQQ